MKKPLVEKLEKFENRLNTLNETLDQLSKKLASQETYENPEVFRELHQEYLETKAKIEKYTARWEDVALRLEDLENEFLYGAEKETGTA